MRAKHAAVLVVVGAWILCASPASAGELGPGETFIDPMDVSLGFMSPGSPMSPRPQTELHLTPLEFHIMDVNIPLGLWGLASIRNETYYQYHLRLGGKIAFFKRFELGAELLPLHATHASIDAEVLGSTTVYDDTDVNFGNFALHFMGNILSRHGELPLYLSAALRVTFPTAGDLVLDLNGDAGPGGEEIEAKLDNWILEPQLIFGITIADMVTLSTRQGLAMIIVGDTRRYPFQGDDQIHWYMNFAVGVAPIRQWFSVVLDFTGMFCMNPVDYTTIQRDWDRGHPRFLMLGVGAKAYPLDPLTIELAARFGLNEETRQSLSAYAVTLNVSWEFDFSIGGVTVIKEGQTQKTLEGSGGDDDDEG